MTNNSGYINETADTVNETELFQFCGQYRLTTVQMQEKHLICDKRIIYIDKNVKLLKNQCLGFAYLESNCIIKIKIGFSMVTWLKTGCLSELTVWFLFKFFLIAIQLRGYPWLTRIDQIS